MKKVLCMLVCFAMLLGVFANTVAAMPVGSGIELPDVLLPSQPENNEPDDPDPVGLEFLTFTDKGTYYELTKCDNSATGEIVIPSSATVDGKTLPVTTIGSGAFSGCTKITKITLPSTIKNISIWTFTGCESLKDFQVSKNNKYYYSVDGVLCKRSYGMTRLTAYPIGRTDKEYTVPDGIEEISESAFRGCKSLENIYLSDTVSSIGSSVFELWA